MNRVAREYKPQQQADAYLSRGTGSAAHKKRQASPAVLADAASVKGSVVSAGPAARSSPSSFDYDSAVRSLMQRAAPQPKVEVPPPVLTKLAPRSGNGQPAVVAPPSRTVAICDAAASTSTTRNHFFKATTYVVQPEAAPRSPSAEAEWRRMPAETRAALILRSS